MDYGNAIVSYLAKRPVQVTKYRARVGIGRSQTYGIVGRRSVAPDISRTTCNNVDLYSLLLDYAKCHVPITFTSIQVNQNYACKEHKDLHNVGMSYIVAFGDFTGGELIIEGVKHDIRGGLLFDGSKLTHSTAPWVGNRITLVYHTITSKWPVPSLSDYTVIDGKIRAPNGDLYYAGHTPPHPIKGLRR
jgi:hypothetical protein